MKPLRSILVLSISLLVLASCSSSLQQRQVADDLYYTPSGSSNKQITKELEQDVKKAVDQYKQLDTVVDMKRSTNPYEEVLVDDLMEARERRDKAMRSKSYGMTNLYDITNSDAYWYASTYDPMFYNMIVMGDDVWVEPNYLSHSFVHGYHYNYGYYNSPYSHWSSNHHPFYPYSNYFGARYGYGYFGVSDYYGARYGYGNFGNSNYYAYGGYSNYFGYPYGYTPWIDFSSPYFQSKRKYPNRLTINSNNSEASPSITRYYENNKKATLTTKGRGDKIRTINKAYEGKREGYIRTVDRKKDRSGYVSRYENNSRSNSTYRNSNTVRKYINKSSEDNSRSRNTRRYYRRPDNESNYNELKRQRRDSYYRSNNNSSSNRNYNRNNNSSYDNNNSRSNNRSINRNSGSSSSGNSSSSSSGRKKR